MATILDYLTQYGQEDFSQRPLGAVDILIINELGYLPFGDHLDLSQPVNLAQARLTIEEEEQTQPNYDFLVTKERVELVDLVTRSARFADLELVAYLNEVSQEFEKQFAALVFRLPSIGHTQLVFRGTDDSLIGWKEDFQLTYMREIPAQRQAKAYLEAFLGQCPDQLVVTGHSKGGNLAVVAASGLAQDLQDKISQVYMLDAPGLHQTVLASPGYARIRERVQVIRPKESIVGVMLEHDLPCLIVDSQGAGISQHNAGNWLIEDGDFLPVAEGTKLSQALEVTFKEWTNALTSQELKMLIDTVFDSLLSQGIESLNDFQDFATLSKALTALGQVPTDKKSLIQKSISQLWTIFWKQEMEQRKPQASLRDRLRRPELGET